MIVRQNFPLSEIVYYKIGGPAKFLLTIENSNDLQEALDFIKKHTIEKILPIGLGSNILINNTPFNGVVLHFSQPKNSKLELVDGFVKVFASHHLDDVIQFGFKNNLTGLEWAGGLPSLVGAAVRGNVGAFGGEIRHQVEKVEVVESSFAKASEDENIFVKKNLTKDELEFAYRDSVIKQNKNLIVSTVYFKLNKATSAQLDEARQIYNDHIRYREEHHPMEYPSCGSVFKNITDAKHVEKIISVWPDVGGLSQQKWHNKISMGYIINRLGFSGKTNGGAQVSEKHSNYIVNKEKAEFSDVLGLISEVKKRFYEEFGFYPEPEVEIVE